MILYVLGTHRCQDYASQMMIINNKKIIGSLSLQFIKQPGRVVEECKLRVIYLPPPQPPSPVLEEPNKGISPKVTFNSRSFNGSSEVRYKTVRSLISKLTDEKNAAIQQSNKIRKEIELLKRGGNKSQGGGVSIILVIIICLIGLILGYLMK
ncbi:vesicle-associated protein 1-2-like [Bidens hawaiensis]|uniref:vesicle-associated protein 1-2-like n=1 Tax=Bidens hawaiensis TaxID=980011 RepID=UPI0040490F7D